ncbi:MAG: hypothetical protein RQ754_14430 [Desulfuromonadales bacterium]|nr:hypothetical protein [Desulfuromonadales bacterium]
MKTYIFMLLAICLVASGCTSFSGLKPVYPDVGNPNMPKQIDSLQPTFKWEASAGSDATYDLIVYEGIKIESFWEGVKRSVGKEIYYKEGLGITEHMIEKPLEPAREYYWTVRTRHGNNVSDWAKYDYTLFLGTAYLKAGNQPFIFRTPSQ